MKKGLIREDKAREMGRVARLQGEIAALHCGEQDLFTDLSG